MATTGRMIKWSIELSEFSLVFKPRKAIKTQALVDFVADCTISSDPTPITFPPIETSDIDPLLKPIPTIATVETWKLFTDGSFS